MAQVSVPANGFPGISTNYVGWDLTRPFALTVAHKGNLPINFQTNGTQRMHVANATGFVGIGTGFTAPTNLLHIASDANAGYAQITNATTGNLLTDGFHFGIEANGNALIRQMENAPIYFQTVGVQRLKINGNTPYKVNGATIPRQGFVLLSPLQNPALSGSTGNIFDADRGAFSMLHLHGNGTVPEFGV